VTVDPVIGTQTVGSQYLFLPPGYPPNEPPWELAFELEVAVNRFLVSQAITGQCTAYFYSYYKDSEAGGRGVLYADNAGTPTYRKSASETQIDFDVRGGKPAGWRSGTFMAAETIPAGSYIWFGAFAEYFFYPRFDYGVTLYHYWYEHLGYNIPSTFPGQATYNMKLSMYFEYTGSQAFTRTLTQGVSLGDVSCRVTAASRRPVPTAGVSGRGESCLSRLRRVLEGLGVFCAAGGLGCYLRGLVTVAGGNAEAGASGAYYRAATETVQAESIVKRGLLLFVRIITGAFIRDYIIGRFLKARTELALKSRVSKEIILESRISEQ
jgi:hypothetical protein